jgi:signal transduction histidine kinase
VDRGRDRTGPYPSRQTSELIPPRLFHAIACLKPKCEVGATPRLGLWHFAKANFVVEASSDRFPEQVFASCPGRLIAALGPVQEGDPLKNEFLVNIGHEIRTPLNAIIGFAELMFKGKVGPVSDDHKEYLGDILESSRHLLQLINDALDIAKLASDNMPFHAEPTDPRRVVVEVRDMLRGLATSKRIRVDTELDPAVEEVVLDPGKLKQLLYNYLSNALKFTPEDGYVRIHLAPEGSDHFRIEVEDSGIGIHHSDMPRVFVEFQRLDAGMVKKYPGTGLGLALTKRIVEAQGGRVGVKSEPPNGSTFWAVLPRRPGI